MYPKLLCSSTFKISLVHSKLKGNPKTIKFKMKWASVTEQWLNLILIGQESLYQAEKRPLGNVGTLNPTDAASECLLKMTRVKDIKGTSSRQVQKMALKEPLTNYPVKLTGKHSWNASLSSYKRRLIAYWIAILLSFQPTSTCRRVPKLW